MYVEELKAHILAEDKAGGLARVGSQIETVDDKNDRKRQNQMYGGGWNIYSVP